jgi:hypothetical protein
MRTMTNPLIDDRDVARYADRIADVRDGRVTAAELAGVVG